MPDVTDWIAAVRTSHDRLEALLTGLPADEVTAPSYASEWSFADVASHLGSQAEIFGLFLDAGLTGAPTPGGEAFGPVWDRWNALPPGEQVAQSLAADDAFVTRMEHLTPGQRDTVSLELFGAPADLGVLLGMRLGEHALHTWDVAVMLDPAATLAPDATVLLLDTLTARAGRTGTPVEPVGTVALTTVDPARDFVLTATPAVELADGPGDDPLVLPAEALLRLVAGRLDPAHTPAAIADDPRLPGLRLVFPGY